MIDAEITRPVMAKMIRKVDALCAHFSKAYRRDLYRCGLRKPVRVVFQPSLHHREGLESTLLDSAATRLRSRPCRKCSTARVQCASSQWPLAAINHELRPVGCDTRQRLCSCRSGGPIHCANHRGRGSPYPRRINKF